MNKSKSIYRTWLIKHFAIYLKIHFFAKILLSKHTKLSPDLKILQIRKRNWFFVILKNKQKKQQWKCIVIKNKKVAKEINKSDVTAYVNLYHLWRKDNVSFAEPDDITYAPADCILKLGIHR